MMGFISELYRELLDWSIVPFTAICIGLMAEGIRTGSNQIRLYWKKGGCPKILDLAGYPPITVKRYCSESGMTKDTLVPSRASL